MAAESRSSRHPQESLLQGDESEALTDHWTSDSEGAMWLLRHSVGVATGWDAWAVVVCLFKKGQCILQNIAFTGHLVLVWPTPELCPHSSYQNGACSQYWLSTVRAVPRLWSCLWCLWTGGYLVSALCEHLVCYFSLFIFIFLHHWAKTLSLHRGGSQQLG